MFKAIWDAIFGEMTYRYKVNFINKSGFIEVEARDFIDAHIMARTLQQSKVAYIEPIDNVMSTKGENGANMYLFNAIIKATVFGQSEERAKQNFKAHMTDESIQLVEAKTPIWVNEQYYKKGY